MLLKQIGGNASLSTLLPAHALVGLPTCESGPGPSSVLTLAATEERAAAETIATAAITNLLTIAPPGDPASSTGVYVGGWVAPEPLKLAERIRCWEYVGRGNSCQSFGEQLGKTATGSRPQPAGLEKCSYAIADGVHDNDHQG